VGRYGQVKAPSSTGRCISRRCFRRGRSRSRPSSASRSTRSSRSHGTRCSCASTNGRGWCASTWRCATTRHTRSCSIHRRLQASSSCPSAFSLYGANHAHKTRHTYTRPPAHAHTRTVARTPTRTHTSTHMHKLMLLCADTFWNLRFNLTLARVSGG